MSVDFGTTFDLGGRVAIVTGATGGLGRRFAEVLHAAGANIVAAGRRADRLDELAARLDRCIAVPGDVTDPEDRQSLVRAAIDAYGSVDILVNNAGLSGGKGLPAEDMPWERWQRTFDVNVSALFALTQIAVGRCWLKAVGRSSISLQPSVSSRPVPS